MMKKNNRLDRKQCRAVEDLLESHKEAIEKGQHTMPAFARMASERLGFLITASNIKGAAATVDVHFNGRPNANGKGPSSVKELRAAVHVLASELNRLCGELGVTASPIVKCMAGIDEEEQS